MGRTVRFDQIFVSNMDADPQEQDILTTVRSIITSEIEADEIVVDRIGIANTVPTKSFSIGADLFMESGQEVILDVSKTIKSARMNVTDKIGVKTSNPLHDFQVGDNQEFFIGTGNRDLVTVNGNILASNMTFVNNFELVDKIKMSNSDSNVVHVTGNTFSSNITTGKKLVVGTEATPGSNVAVFQNGNVVIENGALKVTGNVNISGNLAITEIPDYLQVNSLVVSNAVIQMATDPTNSSPFSGNDGVYDMAMLMVQDAASSHPNVFLGYTQIDDTFKLGRTYGGPLDQSFTMDSNTMNLHIFGELYTQNNVGIVNSSPTHTLSIGSNLYVDDTATSSSNILYANGFGFFEGLRIGDSGLTVGDLITLDADAPIPMVVTSTIQSHSIQTTGASSSGISNTSPTDTLSIGNKLFINVTSGGNVLTVLGNTATQRLITESIRVQDFIEVEGESGISSAANVIIHGDIEGGDSVSNTVSIRCGPNTSNVSSIDIQGANTSASHQIIAFKTRSTERMRLAANGNLGIANTAPTEKLTIGGNLKINDSNAAIFGNTQTNMKVYTNPLLRETKVENIVGPGKGLNFYTSTTSTMGTPKLTILESSNVGVGTATPKGRLHTSGGTVFINDQVVTRDVSIESHLGTPLIVTNTSPVILSSDFKNVLQLTREGNSGQTDGVRAIYKMGKHSTAAQASKSQLSLYLANDDYETENHVMSWQSSGRVGIGSTQPSSNLTIITTGIGNSFTNGLLVRNPNTGDAISATRTDNASGNAFASFIQTDSSAQDSEKGWSVGVAGQTGDFRVTQNINEVSANVSTKIYVSGASGNIGIGTDTPRDDIELTGNVVIGNQLTFGGLETDEVGNTFIRERYYNTDGKTELLMYKGNEGALASVTGPDRIRSVAPLHIFQTYDDTGQTAAERETLLESEAITQNALLTINKDRVLVGTSIDPGGNSRLFVDGGFQFATGSKVITGQMDLFSVTTGGNKGIIDNISSALTFRQNGIEYARFTEEGLFGLNTDTPATNVHVYSALTTDTDVLKLESPGTNKKTGITLNTNDSYGGYVRGFSNSQYSVHGTVLGAVNNSTEADGIHIIHTSNVGIGTVNPSERFTVYNGVARLEHSTSNAIMEFKTTGGISNIYGDSTGNVVIDPTLDFIVKSNVEIFGDLQIDGKIDLGNQVAVDLGGSTANTALHVGGGFITGSNQVACKRYSNTFTVTSGNGQDVILTFQPQTFYAKIIAQLREVTNPTSVDNVSTMVLEVQGGTHDGSAPGVDIAIGTKNMFSGLNLYPWSPTVFTGRRSIRFAPYIADGKFFPSGTPTGQTGRNYTYDIFVEVVSGVGGALKHITHNIGNSQSVNLNNGNGGNINVGGVGFVYTY